MSKKIIKRISKMGQRMKVVVIPKTCIEMQAGDFVKIEKIDLKEKEQK